ncbi:hypothetical protein ESA94_03610 [Lacibacter luteus]|uniref:Uncharacterized protein n=1 Tax=Lacibacter luteus TaxID=2508719 RepID=A0A4V1M7Z9_9BACT|nr:hypothetical protein [Lacibacter luteus]RXK62112.1 hypothetical protein ESA94_03610 [Lacibacter luteus]
MRRYHFILLCTFLLMLAVNHTSAQSKVAEVKQSSLTGLALPGGSKQDKRFLSITAAKSVLEMVSKKAGTTIKTTEVLSLLPVAANNFNMQLLKNNLQQSGWNVTDVAGEPQYLWLQQNGKHVLLYLSNDKQQTNLYFGEVSNAPVTMQPTYGNTQQPTQTEQQQQPIQQEQTTQPANTGYHFTSTNFDDGWTSVEQSDWVEVSKPGIKILIHYPNQAVDAYNTDKSQSDNNAWNTLVAQRYSNISNLFDRGIQDYQSITFFTADAINAQGKLVHVVLYKKKYDTGVGRYMEIVTDDKQTFEREFGNNYINRSDWSYMDQIKSWDKLANMQWRNKFAIAPTDLLGKWGANNYASLTYYYVSSGGYAGATATSTSDEFTFLSGNSYQSDHAGASGVVGNQQFSRQAYKGNSTVTDWTISLTNRFQNQSETYNSYFEAVKGGRLLIITDRLGTTLTLAKTH